jgi:hypothetical protein
MRDTRSADASACETPSQQQEQNMCLVRAGEEKDTSRDEHGIRTREEMHIGSCCAAQSINSSSKICVRSPPPPAADMCAARRIPIAFGLEKTLLV